MVKNADFVFSFNRLQARRFAKGYVLLYTLRIKSIGGLLELRLLEPRLLEPQG